MIYVECTDHNPLPLKRIIESRKFEGRDITKEELFTARLAATISAYPTSWIFPESEWESADAKRCFATALLANKLWYEKLSYVIQ